MYLNSKVADKIVAKTASYISSLQEAVSKGKAGGYLNRLTLYNEAKSEPSLNLTVMPFTAAPVQPTPGEYPARGTGNKVSWVSNGHMFNAVTDDLYVKGIDCPCVVLVLPDNTYWVDYSRQ